MSAKACESIRPRLDQQQKANGVVYTPAKLAEYLSTKTFSFILSDFLASQKRQSTSKPFRILDPACGDGELLLAAWRQLNDQLQDPTFRKLRKYFSSVTLC